MRSLDKLRDCIKTLDPVSATAPATGREHAVRALVAVTRAVNV
jgi:hypothetical protein